MSSVGPGEQAVAPGPARAGTSPAKGKGLSAAATRGYSVVGILCLWHSNTLSLFLLHLLQYEPSPCSAAGLVMCSTTRSDYRQLSLAVCCRDAVA